MGYDSSGQLRILTTVC